VSGKTRGERRERREQGRRKMRVTGKSCILLHRLAQERAERVETKEAAVKTGGD